MLERYDKIIQGEKEPYYLQAKRQKEKGVDQIDFSTLETAKLWAELEKKLKEGIPSLELKRELAERILSDCIFCERRCRVNRKEQEKGSCKVAESKVSSEFLHMGEERELVPSHTIFFAGCNLECVFCQNYEISQLNQGIKISPEKLARRIEKSDGKNVNWVGGDPTPDIPYILQVLDELSDPIPQIWNSNMYLTEESMKILSKLMDVYLTDFKYGNDECASNLSGVDDYTSIIKRNHLIAKETGDLIIRHLVLPGHLDCCTKPLLEWIESNLENPRVNIMSQYRPVWNADQHPDIDRFLSDREKKEIKKLRRKYSSLLARR